MRNDREFTWEARRRLIRRQQGLGRSRALAR